MRRAFVVAIVVIVLAAMMTRGGYDWLTREWTHVGHMFLPTDTAFKFAAGTLEARDEVSDLSRRRIGGVGGDVLHFDCRDKWSGYAGFMQIDNQGSCNGCWAINTASAFSDRLFIWTQGLTAIHMSAQELLSCNNLCMRGCTDDDCCSQGCGEGISEHAAIYSIGVGLVSQTCMPFIDGNAANSKETTACPRQLRCTTRYKARDAYLVASAVADIRREIFCRGPVSANMTVYSDFQYYTGGVYSPSSPLPRRVGLHTVRIIGWGTSARGTEFWLCVNSWGRNWGIGGLFKLKVGTVGIEDTVLAIIPEVPYLKTSACVANAPLA